MLTSAKITTHVEDVKDKPAAFGGRRCWTCCTISTPHKDNQAFLHAGFGSGKDALGPYKKTLACWR